MQLRATHAGSARPLAEPSKAADVTQRPRSITSERVVIESQCYRPLSVEEREQDQGVDQTRKSLPTRAEPTVIESCHSTWLFDEERGRFRRVLKGLDVGAHPAATEWRPYFGLDLDPLTGSFAVRLNPEGTRLIRSWRHVEPCEQCGAQRTRELSLEELLAAVRS